jgi:putative transposase
MVRKMLGLSHGKFRERLCYKASQYSDRVVDICNESYSTKSCGRCGHIQEMGGKKVYDCVNCRIKIDRDISGTRSTMLRRLTKSVGGALGKIQPKNLDPTIGRVMVSV